MADYIIRISKQAEKQLDRLNEYQVKLILAFGIAWLVKGKVDKDFSTLSGKIMEKQQ